jgi:phenol 2-monooxygenase (NADPH)
MNQGAIEQSLLDLVSQKFSVERNTTPERLELDRSMIEKEDAYPITITLRHKRKNGGGQACNGHARNGEHAESEGLEIVKAKYLIGSDGAKSWTRKQLNIPLEGNQTDSVWGVMDVIPLTDFRKSLLYLNNLSFAYNSQPTFANHVLFILPSMAVS